MAKDATIPANNQKQPVSIAKRTLVGTLIALILAGMLWADHVNIARWLPPASAGWTGLEGLLESGLLIVLLAAALVALALNEFCSIAAALGADLPRPFFITVGTAIVPLMWAGWAYQHGTFAVCPPWLRHPGLTALFTLAGATFGYIGIRAVAGKIENTALHTGLFATGLIYIPIAFAFLGAVRVWWEVQGLLTFIVVCKFTDIGAYYCGKLIGGPKLAPRVSPNKTWAGAVGGTVAAIAAALVFGASGWIWLSIPQALAYGLLLAIVAMVGDLVESTLKREADIKDSGNLFPGAGGILDIVDDVVFAAPFTYLFFSFAYGH